MEQQNNPPQQPNIHPKSQEQIDAEQRFQVIVGLIENGLSTAKAIFQPKWYKYAFELAILICVIVPITILGYTGKLQENILGTLFGGVIGYTLARFKKGNE